jgi:hypothetical protein
VGGADDEHANSAKGNVGANGEGSLEARGAAKVHSAERSVPALTCGACGWHVTDQMHLVRENGRTAVGSNDL